MAADPTTLDSFEPSSNDQALVVRDSRAVLAHHGRTFDLAGRLLPADRRDDAAIVYAFCRLADDLADEAPDTITARANLDQLRAELRGQRVRRPLVVAFLDVCERRRLDPQAAEYLLRGILSDLDPVALRTDGELLRYSYCVAGTVGLMMCGVIGVVDPVATPHAIDLGLAMQITNICRDVKEDAERGRVYLPAERLTAAGTSTEALLAGKADPNAIRTVVVDLLELAESYYRSADRGMPYIPWRARTAILCAGRMYRDIGRRIVVRELDVMQGRTWVPTYKKLAWLGYGLARAPFMSTAPHDARLHHALRNLPGAAQNA